MNDLGLIFVVIGICCALLIVGLLSVWHDLAEAHSLSGPLMDDSKMQCKAAATESRHHQPAAGNQRAGCA